MDKRARYRKSAVRSTDQALHPVGKDTSLAKTDKPKKKVGFRDDDAKEEVKAEVKKETLEVIHEDDDDKDDMRVEIRESKPLPREESKEENKHVEKRPPKAKASNDTAALARKQKLQEIK